LKAVQCFTVARSQLRKGCSVCPWKGFFPRGALLEVYLVEWDLVFGSGSLLGRFGDEGHYEYFRILMGLLCHL